MKSSFRPSTPADRAGIVALAQRAFGADPDAAFIDASLMRWKYWLPRDDFSEPRSFVMERNGRVIAHAGLWPVMAGGERGAHMIDWMSDPDAPGAGVAVLQRVAQRFDFLYTIGGSRMTIEILPKFGFKHIGDAVTCARPLRPLRQVIHHQYKDWRLPARLVRNLWWSLSPRPPSLSGWSAEPASASADPGPNEAFLRYLSTCPTATWLRLDIKKEGRRVGFMGLMTAQQQSRIAGIWLADPSVGRRDIALALAQRTLLARSTTAEILDRAFATAALQANEAAGMRARASDPVLVFKRNGNVDGLELSFELAGNDAICLWERAPTFLT